jgi:hypothetical protein
MLCGRIKHAKTPQALNNGFLQKFNGFLQKLQKQPFEFVDAKV